jgi:DNA-binding winged helix-turn-helix (wHTH) protein/predicted ATPase
MRQGTLYTFQEFVLDVDNAYLRQGQEQRPLRPKAFDMLRYFVERPGQLVTRDELFQALWPHIVVDGATLTGCIRELRIVLKDDAKQPRFIETVPRRGYRFIASVAASAAPVSSSRFQVSSAQTGDRNPQLETRNLKLEIPLVGRDAELTWLSRCFEKALSGQRQIVFVTGEAGIGKTTLVEAFLQKMLDASLWIGRGQCIEYHGAGEAYLPMLEALGRLCRESDGKRLITFLGQHAPTWLVQMPALLSAAELETLQRKVLGATRERMLREMAEALEVVTAERPLILWFEDVQWSDPSTLDWLAYMARRPEPARLLVLCTYRPVDVIVREHPLQALKQELQLHRYCQELSLGLLSERDVTAYLERRLAKRDAAQAVLPVQNLARVIYQRTEGNPFFMVGLADYLEAQGLLVNSEGEGKWQGQLAAVKQGVPDNLRQFIEQQIARLSPEEQLILQTASIVGAEFSVAAVAAAAGQRTSQIEARCERLVRRGQFLRQCGIDEWPDGTVATKYGFLHALYHEAVYGQVSPGRRMGLHQRIGERIETAYGNRTQEVATALAMHFERSRDHGRAVRYLQQAGEQAIRRSAYSEAISLATKGLELLQTLPETPERDRQELVCQVNLGAAQVATKGYAAPEVETAYLRAMDLCQSAGEAPQLFPVLWGLWAVYAVRADHTKALTLGERLLALAQQQQDPAFLAQAHWAMGQPLLFLGALARASEHFAQGVALYDPQRHRPDQSPVFRAGQDPGVNCLAMAARIPWLLGYPDQAIQKVHEALSLAHSLRHPLTLGYALGAAAIIHQLCREPREAQECADAAIALCTEHGLSFYLALGRIWRGWALTEQGELGEGVALLQQGLTTWRALGAEIGLTHYLTPLIEAHRKAGHLQEAETVLAEAFALVEKNAEHFYEAELYRLKGELLRMGEREKGGKGEEISHSPTPPFAPSSPEACFLKAIEIARRQQAKSLELRATTSLARLWQQQGKHHAARTTLSEIYNWFTEGFDTKDLQEAKALLDSLESGV